MRILLTNDDGIHAPGLQALRDALSELGEVLVVAPDAEQSGVGLSVTYLHPLMAREEWRDGKQFGWAVAGSPADCVKLGVLQFSETKPDLVVSGINSGSNAGINVLYSGTVAGAIEGAFFGLTSVAVSTSLETAPDYPATARMATMLIRQLVDRGPERGSLWNMNFPAVRPGWPRGVKFVPMGVRRHAELMEKRIDPRGRAYYWSGINALEKKQLEPGTDLFELLDGYATVTPLHFDLTERRLLESFGAGEWRLAEE